MFFLLLLCWFNFNHINGSLDPLDILYKEKKDLILDNWLLLLGWAVKKVYNVYFYVTLFQDLFSFFS